MPGSGLSLSPSLPAKLNESHLKISFSGLLWIKGFSRDFRRISFLGIESSGTRLDYRIEALKFLRIGSIWYRFQRILRIRSHLSEKILTRKEGAPALCSCQNKYSDSSPCDGEAATRCDSSILMFGNPVLFLRCSQRLFRCQFPWFGIP